MVEAIGKENCNRMIFDLFLVVIIHQYVVLQVSKSNKLQLSVSHVHVPDNLRGFLHIPVSPAWCRSSSGIFTSMLFKESYLIISSHIDKNETAPRTKGILIIRNVNKERTISLLLESNSSEYPL